MITTKKSTDWTSRYGDALRTFVDGHSERMNPASALGREAANQGRALRTVAQTHEQAWIELASTRDVATPSSPQARRSARFFTATLLAMTSPSASRASPSTPKTDPSDGASLRGSRAELAKSQRQLKREIARREASDKEVKLGKERSRVLSAQSKVLQEKLRGFARKLLSAQEEERREISRELHDEVVQILVGINVELSALSKAAAIGTKAFKLKIVSTQQLVEKSVSAVHQFARDLRPAVLDDLGLIPALQAYLKTVAARKKMRIRLTAFAGVEAMAAEKRIVLYRVAQEALTNVVRHAKASLVNMSISQIPGAIRMEVQDNGKSFSVARALESRTHKRLGLLGMRERVEMVGGTLTIESSPGHGTTVRADIPYSAKPGDSK